MHYSKYIIMAILLLYWLRASNKGALVLLINYILYIPLTLIPAEDYSYYYVCASLLSLAVGYVLQKINLLAAICSYSLVFVNVYGFYLWLNYLPPDIYDNICLLILITQLVLITPRGLFNGSGYNNKHTMDKHVSFNSIQARVIMCKNSSTKEKEQ